MRIHASAHSDATEPIRIHDRSDLDVSIVTTGPEYGDHWQIKGTAAERVTFLRRLAEQAAEAAYRLAVQVEADERAGVAS